LGSAIVTNSPLLIVYAAPVFSALAIGGLVGLRALRGNAVPRAIFFVALCFVAVRGTFWLSRRWDLDPVGLAYAWSGALVIVVGVEALYRFWSRNRIIS
jgi:hypothetical protein